MRSLVPWTLAAALVAALPITARAQQSGSQPAPGVGATTPDNPSPQTPGTTTTTSTSTPGTTAAGGQTTTTTSADTTTSGGWFSAQPSHWMAAGFVGANYGASTTNTSVDFGGQVGYLYRGVVGGEFLADFAPTFEMNNAFLAERPFVNAYMANAMLSIPVGSQHQVQPYVSGGFGGIQLRSNVLAIASVPTSAQTSTNQTKGGGDIGFGVLGFAGNVGVRGDVRYFRAFTGSGATIGSTTTAADVLSQNLLSGLDFWRANIGIAVRW